MQKPPSEDFFRYMQKQGHVPEGMDYTTFKGKMANPEVRKAYHAGLQKEKVYSGSLQQFEEQELADIVPKKKNTASGQQSKQPTSPSVPNTGQEGQTVESDQASGTDGQLPLAPLGVAGSGPSYNKVPDAETNPFGFKEYNTQDNLQPVARQQAQEYEGEIARSKKRSYDRVKQSGQQPYVAPDLDAANTFNYSSAEGSYLETQFARGDKRLPLGQLPAFDLKRAIAPYESELKDAAFVYEDVMANLKVKYGKDFFTQIEQNTAKRNELVTRFNQSKSRQEQEQIMATVQQIDNSMAKFKEDPLFADLTLAANTIQKNTQALKEIESDPRTALARELDAEAKKRKQAQDRFELDHPTLKYANAFLNGITGGTDKMLTGAMQLPLLAAGAIGVDVAADEAARMGAGLQQRAGMIRPTSTRQDLGGFYNYVEMDGNRYVIDKGKVVSAMDKNKQGLTITEKQSKKVEEAITNGEADVQEDFDLGAGMLSSFQVVGEIIPQVLGTKGLNSLLSAGSRLGATAGLATTANNYAKTSSIMVNMALTANDLYQDGINIYGDTEEGRRKAAQFSLLTSGAVSVATAQIGIEDRLASGTDAIRAIFRSNPTLAASLRTMTTADAVKAVMQIYATNITSEVLEESVIEPGVEYAARAMLNANPEFDIQEAKNSAVAAAVSAVLLGSLTVRSDYKAQNRERALESFALIGQQSSRAISTIGDLQRAGRLRGAGEAEGETPERQRRNAAAYVNTARQAQMVINDNNLEGEDAERVLELAYQAAELQLESGSTALNATVNAKIKQLNDEIAAAVIGSQKPKVDPETQAKVLAINEEMTKANTAVKEAVNTIVDLDTGGLDGEIKAKSAQRTSNDPLGRIDALIASAETEIQKMEDAGQDFAPEMQVLAKYNEAKVNLVAAQDALAANQAQLSALDAEAMPQGVPQSEVKPLKIVEEDAAKQNVSEEVVDTENPTAETEYQEQAKAEYDDAVQSIIDVETEFLKEDAASRAIVAQQVKNDPLAAIEAQIESVKRINKERESNGAEPITDLLNVYTAMKARLVAAQDGIANFNKRPQPTNTEATSTPQAPKQNVSGGPTPVETTASDPLATAPTPAKPASTSDATSWTVESDDKQTVITFGKAKPTAKDLSVLNAIGAKVDMDKGTITVKPGLRKQVNRMFPELGIIAPLPVAVSNEAPIAESTQDSDTVKQGDTDAKEVDPDQQTKDQVREFGVAEEDVAPVTSLLNRVFEGLKAAGLVVQETVNDWVGIGKGENNDDDVRLLQLGGKQVEVKKVQADVVNGFYSNTENALAQVAQQKMSGNQWATQLLSRGANKEELAWTGLEGFLKENAANSISKADIEQFLKDNRIEIVEVVKGDVGNFNTRFGNLVPSEIKSKIDYIKYNKSNLTIEQNRKGSWNIYDYNNSPLPILKEVGSKEVAEDIIANPSKYENSQPTKFSTYQLEGDKNNYKEVLITMPSKERIEIFSVKEEIEYEKKGYVIESDMNFTPPKNYAIKEGPNAVKFKSSHFDEPNILVHLRMNTRVDADGKKVLFLEEVQSDWGQKGKKEGFVMHKGTPFSIKNDIGETLWGVKDEKGEIIIKAVYLDKNDAITAQDRLDGKTISSAPFVTDTTAWTKLGLKVALKEAVKQGADKIAWTTGEQQNERYDLIKQVDKIEVESIPQVNGLIYLDIYLANGSTQNLEVENGIIRDGDYKGQRLDSIIGKDYADKVLSTPKGERQTLQGEDLKVGGKGMKGFYGSPTEGKLGIVGEVAKKLFKQEPKTVTLETSRIDAETTWTEDVDGIQYVEYNGVEKEFETEEEAKAYVNELRSSKSVQHSIDITPEMRASVEEGQSLFQTRSGNPIDFNYDTNKVARERFNFSDLTLIGSGSDRDVYDLGDGKVLKVAKTARGLTQNIHEGDDALSSLLPKVFERGLNYVIAEKVELPAKNKEEKYKEYVYTEFEKAGYVIGEQGGMLYVEDAETQDAVAFDELPKKLQKIGEGYGYLIGDPEYKGAKVDYDLALNVIQQGNTSNVFIDNMLNDLSKFTQDDFDNKDAKLQDVLARYKLTGIIGQDVLWADFTAKRNWGVKNGRPIHLDGGTFGGMKMLLNGDTELTKKQFQEIYEESKRLKKQFGDTDSQSLYQGEANAQYRIQSGKNTVEALKEFDGSPAAVTAITHEIMHPTVVAIFDGAAAGNEAGVRHANTIVNEFNKAFPNSQITLEEALAGNEMFKAGEVSQSYRAIQEFIAESWEQYHFENKRGASKAFQQVLDLITKAFKSAYSALTSKELTPELTQFFNEIIGETNVKIQKPLVLPGFTRPVVEAKKPILNAKGEQMLGDPEAYAANRIEGFEMSFTSADGKVYNGKYVLTTGQALTASHNENNTAEINPNFPIGPDGKPMNSREYLPGTTEAIEVQVRAEDFNGKALASIPVVAPNTGVVISGNGRTMSRRLAAKNEKDTEYMNRLRGNAHLYGITQEQIDATPGAYLVIELNEEPEYSVALFHLFNKPTEIGESPLVRAARISRTLVNDNAKLSALAKLFDGFKTPGEASNDAKFPAQFVSFMKRNGFMNEADAAKYVSPSGLLTEEGKILVESVALAAAYPSDLIRMLDMEGMGLIKLRLVSGILPLIQNRMLGDKKSLQPHMMGAIRLAYQAKKAGLKVHELVGTMSLMGNADIFTIEEAGLALMFETNNSQVEKAEFRALVNSINSRVSTASLMGEAETVSDVLTEYAEAGLRMTKKEYNARNEMKAKTTVRPELLAMEKAGGVKDLVRIFMQQYNMSSGRAVAAAFVVHDMAKEMAKRSGKTIDEVYQSISWTKQEPGKGDNVTTQENKKTGLPRIAVTIEDASVVVHALTDPNVSSPIHAMAKAFKSVLTEEEQATVLEWAKHKTWNNATSEVFARGFERFLHEGGKTDEQGNSVNKIFKALAGFLKQVYKSLRESSLYKPLNPKVRTMYANIAAMDSDFAKELEGLGLSEENLKAAKFELGLTLTDEDQELVDIANDMAKGVEEIEVKGATAANVQEPIIPLKANREGVLEKGKAFVEAYGRKIDKLRTDFKSLLTSVYTELTEGKIDTLMSIIDEHATIAIQNGVVQGIAEYYELLPKVISVDNAINMFGNDKPGTVPNTIEKGGMKVGVRGLIGLGLGANLHKEKLDAGMSGWNGVDAYEGDNFIYDPLQGTWKLKGGIAVVHIQKMESIKPNTTKTLGELIDSPVLFAAYPELAGIKVNVATSVDKTGTINASFDIQNMSIDLKTSNEQNMIDSLKHETQHAIQMMENNDNVKLNENKLILDAFAVIPLDERNALLAEIVRNDNTRDAVGNVLSKITNYPLNNAPRTDASPELKAACVNLFTDYIYALENEVVRSKGQFEVDPTRSINSFAYQAHAAEFEAFNVESEENARFREKQYPQRVAMNADIKLIHKELSKSGSSRVAMGQVRFGTGLFGHVDKFADMVVASNNADATTMEAASAALLQDLLAAAEAKNEQAQRTNGYLASNEIAKSAAKIGVDNTQNETQANRLSFFTMLQSTGDAMKSAFRGGVRNLILTRQLLLNGNASWPTHALRNGNGIDRMAHKALLKATSASIADTPKDKYPEQALALLYQQVFGYSKGMDEGEAAAKFVQAINKGFEGDISTMDKTEMTKKLHQAMLEQSANILYSQNPIMMRLLATTLRNASPNSTGVLDEEAALNDPRIVAEQLEYLVSADEYLKDYKDGVFQMRGKKKTKLTKALSAARSLLGALKYKSIEDSGTFENQVGDDFKQSYYDKFNALHKAVEKDKDLRTMKGKEQLADEDNASDLIKLQQGRIAAKNDKLVDWFNGQSSAKIVQGAATANSWVGRMTKLTKSTFDEVSLYMHARHAVSRNARVAEMAVNRREAEVARLTVQIDRVEDLIAAELDSSAIVDRYKDRIAALEQSIADGLSPAKQYRAEQKIEKLQEMVADRIAGKMNSKRIEALQNKLTEIQKQIEFVESAIDYDSEIKELAQQRDDLAKEALAAKAQNNQVKFDRIMQDYIDVSYRLKEIAEENPYVNSFAGSGMLTSTANGIVAEFEGRATKEAVEELANEFYDNTTRAKIEQLFENGFINLERYEALKSGMKGGILTFDPDSGMTMDDSNALDTLLENYLPLSVKQEYYEGADDYISGSDLGSAAVSDLVGTDSYGIMERDNPVINAVAQMNSTNRAVETNKTKKAMVGMMSGGNFYKWRIYKFGPMRLTLQKGGDFASGNEEKDLSRHVVEENSISYQDEGNTYYLFIPPVEGENGARSVNPIVTIFKNKDNKNAAGIEYIFRIFRAMGTYLRLTATSLNMSFTLWNNPLRDIFEANANLSSLPRKDLLKIRAKTMRYLPSAVATLTRNKFNNTNTSKLDKYWADAIEDGVEMSWNADGSRVDYAQKLEAFTERFNAGARSKTIGDRFDTALDALTTLSDITENMTRLAVYAAVRDAGMSRQQAAIVAKEITVNFEQKGESIGKLNAMYTFLNAQIIGTFRSTAALATKAGLRFYVYCTLFGIANAMLKHGLSGDDDDEYLYDTVLMERKVLIPNPMDPKNPIRLPRPMSVFGAGEMMGELVYEALINRKMNIYEAVSIAFNKHLQSINPISRDHVMFQTFAPTPFQPIAAAAENRTYANKPIIYGEEFMTGVGGLPVWQQYNKDPGEVYVNTSEFLSGIGLNFQPDDLKYAMNQYIGTAPKHAYAISLAGYKAAAEAAGVEVKYPYPDKREYPLIGQMYQNTDNELQGKAYLAVGMLANQAEDFNMTEEKYKFVEKMLTTPEIYENLNKRVAKVTMKRLATVRAIMDEQAQPNPDQETIKLLKQDLYAKFKKEESEEE